MAVGWSRTRVQEFIATEDSSLRLDIPDTNTAGVINLEKYEVKKEDNIPFKRLTNNQ
jgi:hypothetical protein